MFYKKMGDTYALRLEKGEEIINSIIARNHWALFRGRDRPQPDDTGLMPRGLKKVCKTAEIQHAKAAEKCLHGIEQPVQ